MADDPYARIAQLEAENAALRERERVTPTRARAARRGAGAADRHRRGAARHRLLADRSSSGARGDRRECAAACASASVTRLRRRWRRCSERSAPMGERAARRSPATRHRRLARGSRPASRSGGPRARTIHVPDMADGRVERSIPESRRVIGLGSPGRSARARCCATACRSAICRRTRRGPAVHATRDRAAGDVRGPGRHRHRERPAVRGAGAAQRRAPGEQPPGHRGAGAADRDGRGPAGHRLSPTDLQPVLDAIVASARAAVRRRRAPCIWRVDGDATLRGAASTGDDHQTATRLPGDSAARSTDVADRAGGAASGGRSTSPTSPTAPGSYPIAVADRRRRSRLPIATSRRRCCAMASAIGVLSRRPLEVRPFTDAADRAAGDVRGPGRHRHRERPAVRGAGAAQRRA